MNQCQVRISAPLFSTPYGLHLKRHLPLVARPLASQIENVTLYTANPAVLNNISLHLSFPSRQPTHHQSGRHCEDPLNLEDRNTGQAVFLIRNDSWRSPPTLIHYAWLPWTRDQNHNYEGPPSCGGPGRHAEHSVLGIPSDGQTGRRRRQHLRGCAGHYERLRAVIGSEPVPILHLLQRRSDTLYLRWRLQAAKRSESSNLR